MNSWEALIKVGLLGTEQSALPAAVIDFLQSKNIDSSKDETTLLLEAAAVFSQLKKVNQRFEVASNFKPAATHTSGQLISPKSAAHLQLLLTKKYKDILPEFLTMLNKAGKVLPPHLLPDLYEKALLDRSFWNAIKDLIGSRGTWLLEQNPAWQSLDYLPDPDDWASEDQQRKLLFFEYLHRYEPGKAIELIEEIWSGIHSSFKVSLLERMALSPDEADEPFLENCLYEDAVKVRAQAVQILAQLPTSEYVERLQIRANDLVQFQEGRLSLNFPDEYDETMVFDGLIDAVNTSQIGATYLYRIFELSNPVNWTAQDKIASFYTAMLKSNYGVLIIEAISKAITKFENTDWAGELLNIYLSKGNLPVFQKCNWAGVLSVVDPVYFNVRMAQQMTDNQSVLTSQSTATKILLTENGPAWSGPLSRAVIARIQSWLLETYQTPESRLIYVALLKKAAYHADPEQLEFYKKGWQNGIDRSGQILEAAESFIQTIIFRKSMLTALVND